MRCRNNYLFQQRSDCMVTNPSTLYALLTSLFARWLQGLKSLSRFLGKSLNKRRISITFFYFCSLILWLLIWLQVNWSQWGHWVPPFLLDNATVVNSPIQLFWFVNNRTCLCKCEIRATWLKTVTKQTVSCLRFSFSLIVSTIFFQID